MTWKSFFSCGASFPAGFRVAEILWWAMMGGREHISTGEIFTQRVAIFGRVLVHSDTARAVHMVIFGFFSRQTCGESQIPFVVDAAAREQCQLQ